MFNFYIRRIYKKTNAIKRGLWIINKNKRKEVAELNENHIRSKTLQQQTKNQFHKQIRHRASNDYYASA